MSKFKRLCTAIIHFEEIFNKIVESTNSFSPSPYNNLRFKRNWRDISYLALLPLTQAQSIDHIEAIEPKTENVDRLLHFIEPPINDTYKANYCWSMMNFFEWYDPKYDEELRFCQSLSCQNASDAIKLIELFVIFV